jgi:peptidoglycan/LPS O-acetylase OafA/YrhL
MNGSGSGSESGSASRDTWPALTSLRFIAALWIAVFHLWRFDRWSTPAVVEHVVVAAPVAVSFFFVLSGFLLTVSYVDDAGRLSTTARAFWRARFARVMPLYWLSLVVAAPIAVALWRKAGADPAALSDVVKDLAAAAFVVQGWIPGRALAINPPAWSIVVEVAFYAVFPVIAPYLVREARRAPGQWLAGLWLLSVAPGVALIFADPDGVVLARGFVAHDVHAYWLDIVKYHPLLRLSELLLGVVVGARFAGGSRVKAGAGVAAAIGVVVVAAAGLPYTVQHNGLLAPLFALIIVAAASSSSSSSSSLLAARPLVKLGEASYALYLLHVPLLWWIAGIGERRTGAKILEDPAHAAAALAFVVVASVVVYAAFEDPLRRRLRGRR